MVLLSIVLPGMCAPHVTVAIMPKQDIPLMIVKTLSAQRKLKTKRRIPKYCIQGGAAS
jgi:hypothetical protein